MSVPIAGVAPVSRRVRAYFAPVNRAGSAPTLFDPANIASFNVDAPPAPWVDLGWCSGFVRKSGTHIAALNTGAPAMAAGQARTEVEATVSLEFESWGKLQLALAAGVQQMNVLKPAAGAAANGSGGVAATALPLATDSTATALDVGTTAAPSFNVGDVVAVDVDYVAQVGFVGSGVSGGYVTSPVAVASDPNYIRRVTLNVGRVTAIAGGVLTLGAPLPAGIPVTGMKVSPVAAFCDREGGGFFQEWSALFVLDGAEGDRVIFHYPRLQSMAGIAEKTEALAGGLAKLRLAGTFRALPVVDANDGERVVCFRSYLAAALRAV
ncbi:hypothetical protein SAMN05421770_101537 [Granulicella rosea]|uniref:Uncharacterized protein n=1 Tax=Granulicella rosea TaxID=474952 RepID=A0A239DLE2_9BACT|nr:hypothetical protein [Granulicella rosea]SNS33247.1 hypothetical protein SAMN05421770_101537 [Granulicella rosea]